MLIWVNNVFVFNLLLLCVVLLRNNPTCCEICTIAYFRTEVIFDYLATYLLIGCTKLLMSYRYSHKYIKVKRNV